MNNLAIASGVVIILSIALFGGLYAANYPTRERYRNFLFPWSATLVWLLGLGIYLIYLKPAVALIHEFPTAGSQGVLGSLILWMRNILPVGTPEVLLAFEKSLVVILYGYGVGFVALSLKLILKGTNLILLRVWGQELGDIRNAFAYREEDSGAVVLRKEYYFLRVVMKWAVGAATLLLILTLGNLFIEDQWLNFLPSTPYIIVSLVVLLEFLWYLSIVEEKHEKPASQDEEPAVDDASNYRKLWEEYQDIWKERVLVAWYFPAVHTEEEGEKTTHPDVKTLKGRGYSLTPLEQNVLIHISDRRDTIIEKSIYEKIFPLIAFTIFQRISSGENVLILVPQRHTGNQEQIYYQEIKTWIEKWLKDISWQNRSVDIFYRGLVDIQSSVMISSAQNLLEVRLDDLNWFNSMGTILILEGSKMFVEQVNSSNALLNILRKRSPDFQTIVLSDYQEDFQPAVTRNLNVRAKDMTEFGMRYSFPGHNFSIFWKREGQHPFQDKVFTGAVGTYVGTEDILALLAWRDNIPSIRKVRQEILAWDESPEEIEVNRPALLEVPVPNQELNGIASDHILNPPVSAIMKLEPEGMILVHDAEFNLVTAYNKWAHYAHETNFVHIVCPPYLLREYFADNLQYFSKTPIFSLGCEMMLSSYQIAFKLLYRMVREPLGEKELRVELSFIKKDIEYIKEELIHLFRKTFQIDLENNYLNIETRYAFKKETRNFEEVVEYRLGSGIMEDSKLRFLRDVEIRDLSNVLKVLPFDFLFQNYLPYQIHSFDGKPYSIGSFHQNTFIQDVNLNRDRKVLSYRPDLQVQLNARKLNIPESGTPFSWSPRKGLTISLFEGPFTIQTKGYMKFTDAISLNPDYLQYVELTSKVPDRRYNLGRILKMELDPQRLHFDWLADHFYKVSYTLAVLLKEVFFTLYPHSYQYLIVASPVERETLQRLTDPEYLHFPVSSVYGTEWDGERKTIQVYVFEDAFQDMGIVQSIYNNWEYIFGVMADYLHWAFEPKHEADKIPHFREDADFRNLVEQKLDFLKYGFEDFPAYLDLEVTKQLLQVLLKNNPNTVNRNDFYSGGKVRERFRMEENEPMSSPPESEAEINTETETDSDIPEPPGQEPVSESVKPEVAQEETAPTEKDDRIEEVKTYLKDTEMDDMEPPSDTMDGIEAEIVKGQNRNSADNVVEDT